MLVYALADVVRLGVGGLIILKKEIMATATIKGTLSHVVQTFWRNDRPDPTKDIDLGFAGILRRQLRSYKTDDPSPAQQTAIPVRVVKELAKLTATERWVGNTDERVAKMVDDNVNLMNELGIGGTPSMIVADTLIPGLVPYEVLKEQLEAAIAAKDKTQKSS